MTATRAKVEAALRAEARKLDARFRGVHIFSPIWRTLGAGCNWTASFQARGSNAPLDELQAALERIQARLPIVDFG